MSRCSRFDLQKVVVLSAEQALQLAGGDGSVVVTVEEDEEEGTEASRILTALHLPTVWILRSVMVLIA